MTTEGTTGTRAREILEKEKHSFEDVWYTFGKVEPGALILKNYPNFLRRLSNANTKGVVDLGAIDVMRDRERGVPRYNQFRKLIHLNPIRKFEDLFSEKVKKGTKVHGFKVKHERDDKLTKEEKVLAMN